MKASVLPSGARWMLFAALLGSVAATPEPGPSGDEETPGFITMGIQSDERLAGCAVEVTVERGIATLTGTARSLEQAERAGARAVAVDGVRAVINCLKIAESGVSDAILADCVEQRLDRHPAIDASRLHVVVNQRRAILSGEIGSWDEQELAREIATEVPGLSRVESRLVVTFETIRTDPAIEAQILYQVADEPLFSGAEVNVEVKGGVVRLAGEVGSNGEKDALVHLSHVTGVTEVWADDVMINGNFAMEGISGKSISADATLAALKDALAADPRLEKSGIRATLGPNVIRLTGEARTAAARDAAESTARGLPGNWVIENEIRVPGDDKPADPRQGPLASNRALR
jgi:osmotically-inducible protein OsmY